MCVTVQPDAQQPPRRIVERREVHRVIQRPRPLGEVGPVLAQRAPDREQSGGEIAAVYGGEIGRLHDLQRDRVVPVVQVPAPLRQRLHRGENAVDQCFRLALFQVQRPRAERRNQREGNVRRGGAVRRARRRIVLPVVGRKVMVRLRAVRSEVVPDVSSVFQQFCAVVRLQRAVQTTLTAEQPCAHGTDRPEQTDCLACDTG